MNFTEIYPQRYNGPSKESVCDVPSDSIHSQGLFIVHASNDLRHQSNHYPTRALLSEWPCCANNACNNNGADPVCGHSDLLMEDMKPAF